MKFTTQSEALVWAQMMAAAVAAMGPHLVRQVTGQTREGDTPASGVAARIADVALEEYRKRGGA